MEYVTKKLKKGASRNFFRQDMFFEIRKIQKTFHLQQMNEWSNRKIFRSFFLIFSFSFFLLNEKFNSEMKTIWTFFFKNKSNFSQFSK